MELFTLKEKKKKVTEHTMEKLRPEPYYWEKEKKFTFSCTDLSFKFQTQFHRAKPEKTTEINKQTIKNSILM